MSADNFFLEKGFTPMNRVTTISGPNTITVWPTTPGKKVWLTGMSISANQAGTIAFYFEGERNFARFNVSASACITPAIGCVESTMRSGLIFARTLGNSSDGWYVNLTGYETEI